MDAVVPIPSQLNQCPFPGEALGCAINAFRRCKIAPHHRVLIVGIGFIGALLCNLASGVGAQVIAVSRRSYALRIARQFGAAKTIRMDEDWSITAEQLMDLTGGKGCERVIEAVGTQGTLDLASAAVSTSGRLIIAGYHQDGRRSVNMQQWNWRGIDVINAHERDLSTYALGIRVAAEMVVEGKLSPSSLYTHHFALDRLDEAFEVMRARPDGFMKALVII
jgi:threonine dehydrogenase-like Zn-dependent dehydrogenase